MPLGVASALLGAVFPGPARSETGLDGAQDSALAFDRAQHAEKVSRLRSCLASALVMQIPFAALDAVLIGRLESGSLQLVWTIRAATAVLLVAALSQLRRGSPPTPRALRAIDTSVFVLSSAAITLMCLALRGIGSLYGIAIVTLLVARNSYMYDRWTRAILPVGLSVAVYPALLLAAVAVDPRVRSQLHDERSVAMLVANIVAILYTAAACVAGGDTIWRLRQQVFSSRMLGKYRLERPIGAGGMGEVWAARHSTLRREVAIKILRRHDLSARTAVARFEREVQAMVELSHPNTVRVFDYGSTEEGIWYYVMELLQGETLDALVHREGPLEPARAVRILLQTSRAIAEAHALGIVHRDIKPSNVFVSVAGGERDFAKVLDFGIARFLDEERNGPLTRTGGIAGTPGYVSPEVLAGHEATARSDIYAIGMSLYYACTGALPATSTTPAGLLHASGRGEPEAPSVRRGGPLPAGLDALVLRCIATDPAVRFPSAIAVAEALEGLSI